MIEDTIVAQATASGKSGISIVRVSGKNCLDIAKQIFSFKEESINPNFMYFGKIKLGNFYDKGFCVYFKSPKSFTGEDIVEFQCHGGYLIANKIIERCIGFGARLASPGEFSKRAFLNGKMSLDQAEGIVDLINAETSNQLKASNELTNGNLYKIIVDKQEVLTGMMSEIEVNLDYPEHDIEYETKEHLKVRLEQLRSEIKKLIETERTGKLIKQGVDVAIVGKTNVGKSSLLNSLLCYDQAIVTEVEGTTRDIVTGSIEYKDFVFNFFDTAGIRETQDIVENIGIKKSKEILKNSDIVLMILDSSKELSKQDKDNLKLIEGKKSIVVLNKSDLPRKIEYDGKSIQVSAKNKINTEELKEEIYKLALQDCNISSQIILTNFRHVEILKEILFLLDETIQDIINIPLDCVALNLRTIWEKFGEITGESANEKIIDKIFSKFCLGK